MVTIGGAGHSCNMERPWEWDAHFLAFLARRYPLSEQRLVVASAQRLARAGVAAAQALGQRLIAHLDRRPKLGVRVHSQRHGSF